MSRIFLSTVVFVSVISLLGTGCRTRNTDPNAGFRVSLLVGSRGTVFPFPILASVNGFLVQPSGATTGNRTHFNEFFTQGELKRISFAIVPGTWRFTVLGVPGQCFPSLQFMRLDDLARLTCSVNFAELIVTPGDIDVLQPPSTISLYGKSLTGQAGPLRATWYNEFGHVVATSVSQTYSSEGGTVTFSTPNVSNWLNGNYLILVHSTETPTEGSVLGASGIWVHGNENPEPPPQPNPCLQPIPQCSY
ncbi:MAG: hypothetical protein KF762_12460 [Acidobacteria bacterium]|nr:hypothetical protein [Acidobacteriota bacterium]